MAGTEPRFNRIWSAVVPTDLGPVRIRLEEYYPGGNEPVVFHLSGELNTGELVLATETVSLEPREIAQKAWAVLKNAQQWMADQRRPE